MKQVHVFYTGTVQGIGFRYTVQTFAQRLSLVGWVRNLPDGRVEMVAEGAEDTVEKFCQAIDAHFGGYIQHKDKTWKPSSGEFKNFQITHFNG